MNDPPPVDEPVGPPQGSSCLILAVIGAASVVVAIVIIAMVGTILFPQFPKSTDLDPENHPAVGQTLPQLRLEPLVGTDQPVTLDDLAGKVVLVNFWGTWCQPCWYEIPHVAELGKKLQDRPDFKLLAVSCTDRMPEDVVALRRETRTFLMEFKLDMPTYADPDWTTREAFASLGRFGAFPSTFVIDGDGVIRGVWEGYSAEVPKQVEQFVLRLLNEQE